MSQGAWNHDPQDWRVTGRKHPDGHMSAEPRGDGVLENGGWRCAGALPFWGPRTRIDHVIGTPFYIANVDSDTRHCCYCVACAKELLGIEP